MSGYGLLTIRRSGKSALRARDAFPILLRNARRGLAKPSSHGDYLAMDLEPVSVDAPIRGRIGLDRNAQEIGALLMEFDRSQAEMLARREEYSPENFLKLIELADRAAQPLGDFLLDVAKRVNFSFVDYRSALFKALGYSSPGYIFHPLPLDDGRVAIVAIGSGFDGSGDPALKSRRQETGMDRLLKIGEALSQETLPIDYHGQLGYFTECLLGGVHGVSIEDLLQGHNFDGAASHELVERIAKVVHEERSYFLEATSLNQATYAARFGQPDGIRRLFKPGALD